LFSFELQVSVSSIRKVKAWSMCISCLWHEFVDNIYTIHATCHSEK